MIAILLIGSVTCAFAQTVSVPVGQQAPELRNLEVPARGTTQTAVESRFGSPLLKADPVGAPPISSWEYANYYVYFERDLVLHTVLKLK